MKATEELEAELMQQNRFIERVQQRFFIQKGFSDAIKLTLFNYFLFFLIFYTFNNWIIDLPALFFIESAIMFTMAGIISNFKTSVTFTKLANKILGTHFRGDSESHLSGTQNLLRYTLSGVILLLLSVVTFYTYLSFIDLII